MLEVKNPSVNAGDIRNEGLIPGLGRSLRGGHGNPLQYSCLENPTDREGPGGLQSMGLQTVGHDLAHMYKSRIFIQSSTFKNPLLQSWFPRLWDGLTFLLCVWLGKHPFTGNPKVLINFWVSQDTLGKTEKKEGLLRVELASGIGKCFYHLPHTSLMQMFE